MRARAAARYGILLALSLLLGCLERQLPPVSTVPGLRIGLGNSVLLLTLLCFGAGGAWVLAILKPVLCGLLFSGATGMLYALAGSACAMLAMMVGARSRRLSPVGVSVLGASAHMAGQMCVSRFMLGSWAALLQAPLLLAASVAAGIATGVLCRAAMHALRGLDPRIERAVRKMESAKR